MAESLSFRQREPQPVLGSNECLMRARTAALGPSPPRIYQETISLPVEKLGGGQPFEQQPGGIFGFFLEGIEFI